MDELLGPLVLFAVAMTLTPGPNVVLVTASAANFGFQRTVPQMLGITFGFGSMTMARAWDWPGWSRQSRACVSRSSTPARSTSST